MTIADEIRKHDAAAAVERLAEWRSRGCTCETGPIVGIACYRGREKAKSGPFALHTGAECPLRKDQG
jgi:hypothetical protein